MNRKISATNWFEADGPVETTPPPVSIAPPQVVDARSLRGTTRGSVDEEIPRQASPQSKPNRSRSGNSYKYAPTRRDKPRWRGVVSAIGFILLLGFWFVALRPTWLGGSTTVLTVRGVSMEPTYEYGDVIIAHRRSDYGPGDIIAYRVPPGEVGAGTVVIHRIVGGNAVTGFVTQGDGNPDPDDWHPTTPDLLGLAVWHLPAVGRLGSVLHSVPGIAVLAGTIAALLVLFGTEPARPRAGRRRGEITAGVDPLDDMISLPPPPMPRAPARVRSLSSR